MSSAAAARPCRVRVPVSRPRRMQVCVLLRIAVGDRAPAREFTFSHTRTLRAGVPGRQAFVPLGRSRRSIRRGPEGSPVAHSRQLGALRNEKPRRMRCRCTVMSVVVRWMTPPGPNVLSKKTYEQLHIEAASRFPVARLRAYDVDIPAHSCLHCWPCRRLLRSASSRCSC
jgi:hypothetical protein